MHKAIVRQQMIARRKSMTRAEVLKGSAEIATRARQQLAWANISSVHCYQTRVAWNEPDTGWLGAFLYMTWPTIELTVGDATADAPIPRARYDVIFVPIVAFDDVLQRVGMGGGWYDRFLASQPESMKIGLAFECQRAARMMTEPHDIPLDCIITESRILTK